MDACYTRSKKTCATLSRTNFENKIIMNGESIQIKTISREEGEEDPYVTRIKASGCYESHVELQDCYFVKKDWRQCKEEMKKFKACFAAKK